MSLAARLLLAIATLFSLTRLTHAEPLEPPSDQPAGADYEVEAADSLETETVEVGFGATSGSRGSPRQTRRLRFSGHQLNGSLRDGAGDPLAGASVEERVRDGALSLGRLTPRWGRGLVLGGALDPWRLEPADRISASLARGRGGQGVWWKSAAGLEAIAGHFARRDFVGLGFGAGGAHLGALADRRGQVEVSLSLARGLGTSELALDRAGHWRAEGAIERDLGATTLTARARGGLRSFVTLSHPLPHEPAEALAVTLGTGDTRRRLNAIGALWRSAPGSIGARVGFEVERRLSQNDALAFGFEEQHGRLRDGALDPGGFRQGFWGEWRGGPPALELTLRHEAWGERPWARHAVRTATTAHIDAYTALGPVLRVTHVAYQVRSGESLYLPEVGADRLVLRALVGEGARTRLEIGLPLGGGSASVALDLTAGSGQRARTQWAAEWTRRTRLGGRR